MAQKFLRTTSLTETKGSNEEWISLGSWCQEDDEQVVSRVWKTPDIMQRDFNYILGLYESTLDELTDVLNEKHGVKHSKRYWRILIGPWLGYFLQSHYFKWKKVSLALEEHSIGKVAHLDLEEKHMVPNDFRHFLEVSLTEEWNDQMYRFVTSKKAIDQSLVPTSQGLRFENSDFRKPRGSVLRSFVSRIRSYMRFSWHLIGKQETDAFFLSTYLPKNIENRIQKKLGQSPINWTYIPSPKVSLDPKWREWELSKTGSDFEKLAKELIPKYIPINYLEGFSALNRKIETLKWPKHPRFIFTASAFNSDDVFKAWCGEKVESGTKLIVAQHGGHYGIGAWSFSLTHQLKICDSFLSWGWSSEGESKVVPLGQIMFKEQMEGASQGREKLLLVTMCLEKHNRLMYSSFSSESWLSYLEDQFSFVGSLDKDVQRDVLVRLYRRDYGWKQLERWKRRFSDLSYDAGNAKMSDLVSNCKIFVSTYNATTFLESLSMNIPTIMYWDPSQWELSKEVLPFFDELKQVGIFHETPEGAAKKTNEVWNAVDSWWLSVEVQSVRKKFCSQFSNVPENLESKLTDYLRSI